MGWPWARSFGSSVLLVTARQHKTICEFGYKSLNATHLLWNQKKGTYHAYYHYSTASMCVCMLLMCLLGQIHVHTVAGRWQANANNTPWSTSTPTPHLWSKVHTHCVSFWGAILHSICVAGTHLIGHPTPPATPHLWSKVHTHCVSFWGAILHSICVAGTHLIGHPTYTVWANPNHDLPCSLCTHSPVHDFCPCPTLFSPADFVCLCVFMSCSNEPVCSV
jgi:hypothetical protein